MRIAIATPAPPGSTSGNRRTALRYAAVLRTLGHRVRVLERWRTGDDELLVALHARKSRASIVAFGRAHPGRPIVVVLTGTDLYGRGSRAGPVARSLDRATRIVVLQPEALRALPPRWRRKTTAILQSVAAQPARSAVRGRTFDVLALGHMRAVKDPFLAARAARRLPEGSRVRVLHAGEPLDAAHRQRARAEDAANARWTWLGGLSHRSALARLGRADAFVQTSRSEGGSIALAEAVVAGLPVLCTRIPGAVGMLGPRHPGYFEVGDERSLARLLLRAERDRGFRERLVRRSRALARRFAPERERAAWRALLRDPRLRA